MFSLVRDWNCYEISSVHMERIDQPEGTRRLGSVRKNNFGFYLLIKSFWRALHGRGIWWDIFLDKYMKEEDIESIYRDTRQQKTRGSMI